jgi:hypothetical protein
MNLLDRLKLGSAAAMDTLHAIAETFGHETHISIVISHPGTAEDAFIVGEHEMADLFAILTRLETGPAVECDVTSTIVGPNEPRDGIAVQ